MQLYLRATKDKKTQKVRILMKIGLPGQIFTIIGNLFIQEKEWKFLKSVLSPSLNDLVMSIQDIQHYIDNDLEPEEAPDWDRIITRLNRLEMSLSREDILKIEEDQKMIEHPILALVGFVIVNLCFVTRIVVYFIKKGE